MSLLLKLRLGLLGRLFIILLFFAYAGSVSARDILVPQEHASIQAAVNAAAANDVIVVSAGRYEESIVVRSDIELKGVETAETFISTTRSGPIVTVENVSNFKLYNVTLISNDVGIEIEGSTNVLISNVVFNLGPNLTAIKVIDDSSVDIFNNTFYNNSLEIVGGSDMATVNNNIFSNAKIINDPTNPIDDTAYNCFADASHQVGTNFTSGNILFVQEAAGDFHLKAGSVCIDAGVGLDVFDNSSADAGAYGGALADQKPTQVTGVNSVDVTVNDTAPYNVEVTWNANESYFVGGYKLFYDSDQSGAPYEGQNAENSSGQALPSPILVDQPTVSLRLYNLPIPDVRPAAPVLASVGAQNESLILKWSSVADANAYQVGYGLSSSDENLIEVDDVNEYTITGLENDTAYLVVVRAVNRAKYYFAVKAWDKNEPTYESDLSAEETIIIGPIQISEPSNTLMGVPAVIEAFPNLPDQSDSRCFIATAAYGTYSAPQVQLLRQFRDRYLLTNGIGRAFVAWYYKHSPSAADVVQQNAGFKQAVRVMLLPLIALSWLTTDLIGLWVLAIFMFVAMMISLRSMQLKYARCAKDEG